MHTRALSLSWIVDPPQAQGSPLAPYIPQLFLLHKGATTLRGLSEGRSLQAAAKHLNARGGDESGTLTHATATHAAAMSELTRERRLPQRTARETRFSRIHAFTTQNRASGGYILQQDKDLVNRSASVN